MITDTVSVPVEDIAREMKIKPAEVEREARRLHLWVGPDWRGQPVMAAREAARLVSGEAARAAEASARNNRLIGESNSWYRRRDQAMREAGRETRAELRASGKIRSSADEDEHVLAAMREAGRKFEKDTPAELRNMVTFEYSGRKRRR